MLAASDLQLQSAIFMRAAKGGGNPGEGNAYHKTHPQNVLGTPPPTRNTRETGTIWQIGVLTAELSIFRAKKKVIFGRFELGFSEQVRSTFTFVRQMVCRHV